MARLHHRPIRLWQRDHDLITEVTRWPLLTGQITRLHHFPSRKKAAERLLPLHELGLLKRVAYFTPSMQGKPEYVYYTGSRPHPRTIAHTSSIAEARVQLAEWLRASPSYTAEFYYTHELHTTNGLLPDATILVRKGEHVALLYVEYDNGTEPVTSTNGYSLAGKLASYARHFDDRTYERDFPTARGFRVALILPAGRRPQVQSLLAREDYDFVLTITIDRFWKQGFWRPIWTTSDGARVDVLGRPGDLVGDLVAPPIPTTATDNSRSSNEFAPSAGDGF
jgi:hypothetical protein